MPMPNDDGRRHELPGRHAGRTGDDELIAARERQIAGHRADQHREWKQPLHQLRHAEKRRLGNHPGGQIRHVGRAPHHLDIVDQHDEQENAEEYRHHGAEEAHAEVADEGA
jgi:hypothetical protein